MHTTPRTDRVAVVVNTASRTGARALPLVESALRRASEQVLVHPAHGGAELMGALRAAMAEAPDLLVVGGGDGTVGCAAGLVAHTRTTLGVLPLGTANDFARIGDLHADIDGHPFDIAPLLEWAQRDEAEGVDTPPEPDEDE